MYEHVAQLNWLSGDWQGALGPRQVDENWSTPAAGTICARARVIAEGAVDLIELIYIHETDQGLMLTLQQLDAALQPGLHQQMYQVNTAPPAGANSIAFALDGPAPITRLQYTVTGTHSLHIDVTVGNNDVLTAKLSRV